MTAFSGFKAVAISFALVVIGIISMVHAQENPSEAAMWIIIGMLCIGSAIFMIKGLVVVEPNYGIVLTFFGEYVGTLKVNGLQFVNPLYSKLKISLRSQSIESTRLKVNDKLGNPIENAAEIV